MSTLKLNARKDNYERLQLIHQKVSDLIKQYKPVSFAIEAPFFGKNVQSMLKLGRAQGRSYCCGHDCRVGSIGIFAQKAKKQSITGNGNAA